MPHQDELFAPADIATLEAGARAQAERIRRRYQIPERRPAPRSDCPEGVARAHLDAIHQLLDDAPPAGIDTHPIA